ncbi:unnamed protein product, partial [Polarella glacialis]
DEPGSVQRASGKACSDGAVGWFTLQGSNGELNAKVDKKYYTCTTGIAMTDVQNIKCCKVLRKLEVGEVLGLEEGPEVDKDSGVTRIRVVSTKDNLSGWVTIKGNAGTLYAEESSKMYTILRNAPLQKKFPSE